MTDTWQLYDEFDTFSYKHIALGDVDPVYFMIRYSDLTDRQKKRLIFTNLMIYDLSVSFDVVQIEDKEEFYDKIEEVFKAKKVGKDRKDVAERETNPNSRMFGTQIPKMREHMPEEWVDLAIKETTDHLCWGKSVKGGQLVPTFGEYFGFKMADMIETVFDLDISHNYFVHWTEEFRKTIPRGTLTGYEMTRTGKKAGFRKAKEIQKDEDGLLKEFFMKKLETFKDTASPHKPTRKICVTEIETLLCDFRKISKGTLNYSDKVKKCQTAIDKNPNNIYSAGCQVSVDILMHRREYLMQEVGIDNITKEHADECIFEWYQNNKDEVYKKRPDHIGEWV